MTEVLRPGGGGGGGGGSEAARVYHNIGGAMAELPDHMVLNCLLYWYKSTNTDTTGAARIRYTSLAALTKAFLSGTVSGTKVQIPTHLLVQKYRY